VSIDDVADRLYGLPPEEFTAGRDEAARQTDGEDRKALKALRKPTVGAYAVNMLARERGEGLEALADLGEDLRAAMTRGGDIRGLSEQRRELVGELVRGAAEAARRDLTAAQEEEVAATLEAATADPDLGAAVLSGRLVKPLRYAGFGALPDLDDAVATPLPARRAPKAAARAKTAKATTTTKRPETKKAGTAKPDDAPSPAELTRQRSKVLDLAGTADDAQRRYEAASRAVVEARQVLEQAEKERAEAHRTANAAHKEAEKARRDLGRLERS